MSLGNTVFIINIIVIIALNVVSGADVQHRAGKK